MRSLSWMRTSSWRFIPQSSSAVDELYGTTFSIAVSRGCLGMAQKRLSGSGNAHSEADGPYGDSRFRRANESAWTACFRSNGFDATRLSPGPVQDARAQTSPLAAFLLVAWPLFYACFPKRRPLFLKHLNLACVRNVKHPRPLMSSRTSDVIGTRSPELPQIPVEGWRLRLDERPSMNLPAGASDTA